MYKQVAELHIDEEKKGEEQWDGTKVVLGNNYFPKEEESNKVHE